MITRRRVLGAMGACVLSPAMTEGPFFVDERLDRSDITPGAAGVPLLLELSVVNARTGCAPLADVRVDVWHANALGEYSDVGPARGQKFLRGYQVTDASGKVTFRTIYPGWYPGRAVHIHVKARSEKGATYHFREFTSQFFFDEAITERVMAVPPYNTRGRLFTRNAADGIFHDPKARALLVDVMPMPSGYIAKGELALDA